MTAVHRLLARTLRIGSGEAGSAIPSLVAPAAGPASWRGCCGFHLFLLSVSGPAGSFVDLHVAHRIVLSMHCTGLGYSAVVESQY